MSKRRLSNPSDIGGGMGSLRPDADHSRVVRAALIANINVVVAEEILPGQRAHCNVVVAGASTKRLNANGRVGTTGYIVCERRSTNGRVVAAAGIQKERKSTVRSVGVARGVVKKRSTTVGRVVEPGGVRSESTTTDCCVAFAAGVAQKRVSTQEGVGVEKVAAFSANGPRLRRKPKAAERYCHENWQNCCVFGLSQRIHDSSFLFPRYIGSTIRGSG